MVHVVGYLIMIDDAEDVNCISFLDVGIGVTLNAVKAKQKYTFPVTKVLCLF